LLSLLPQTSEDYYKGSEELLLDYPRFLDTFIQYAINEKDIDLQQKYIAILKGLCKKTPLNFSREYQAAQANK